MNVTNQQKDNRKFNEPFEFLDKSGLYKNEISEPIWLLPNGNKLDLTWLRCSFIGESLTQVTMLLAYRCMTVSISTLKSDMNEFKKYGQSLCDLTSFKKVFYQRTDATRKNIKFAITSITKSTDLRFNNTVEFFNEIIIFLNNFELESQNSKIFDPLKGVYSEYEYNSLAEQVRLKTQNTINNLQEYKGISSDDIAVVSAQLLIALVRRPTQLNKMKWCDILPIGVSFKSHLKESGQSPLTEFDFSDIDNLHVRVFKGKDGKFRASAEARSLKLESAVTRMLLLYRKNIQIGLLSATRKLGIELTLDEINELMFRIPVFPQMSLLTRKWKTKSELFTSIGYNSPGFHLSSEHIGQLINRFLIGTPLKSDRINPKDLKLNNNRLRHHVLTKEAMRGKTEDQLAAITDVSPIAVRHYIELDHKARLDIDNKVASHDVYTKFSTQTVASLLASESTRFINEFDEEVAVIKNEANCSSCNSKLGAPLACYPCNNFYPLEDADHEFYYQKAKSKLAFNKEGSDQSVVRKLEIIIQYIEATIALCKVRKNKKGDLLSGK